MITSFVSVAATLLLFTASGVQGQACTKCAVNADGSTSAFSENPAGWTFQGVTNQTCVEISAKLDALAADSSVVDSSPECKNAQLEAFQMGCCTVPPTEYCEICPDGLDYDQFAIVPVSGNNNDPSCEISQFRYASMQGIAKLGDCSDTILQRGGFYCGCPNVQQECFLCPDGATPPNLKRVDAYQTGASCQGAQYLLSVYKADECESVRPNLGVDLAAFCECPGYKMEEPLSNGYEGCTFCPEGQVVKDPEKVHTSSDDEFTRTCAQAEAYTEFITLPFTCNAMQQARDSCCSESGAIAALATSFSFMLAAGVMFVNMFL